MSAVFGEAILTARPAVLPPLVPPIRARRSPPKTRFVIHGPGGGTDRRTSPLSVASWGCQMFVRNAIALILVVASIVQAAADDAGGELKAPTRRYALLIGVRTYSKTELRNLQFTESDVDRLSEALLESGYRKEDIRVLSHKAGVDDADLAPTARNIREQLKLMLSDRRQDESVLVAFAGHGVQFRGKQEHYFCPTDARLSDRTTLVSLTEVYDEMKQCKAGMRLLLVDACRNDPQAEGARSRLEADLESVTRPQILTPPGGVAALFSCSEGERSFEHADLKQGVFFYFVVRGLKGEADSNKDGAVTLSELSDQVQVRVPDFVKSAYSARQRPSLIGDIQGVVPLTRPSLDAGPLARGQRLLTAYQYDDAVAVLTEAIAAEPTNVDCYRARAEAHSGRDDSNSRLADLDQALKLSPDDPTLLNERGWAHMDSCSPKLAAADFDRVTALLTPHDAKSFTLRGDARVGLVKAVDRPIEALALDDLNEAIRRDPKPVDAWLIRSSLHLEKRRFSEALADANEAVRLEPNNWRCYFRRGIVWVNKYSQRNDAIDFDRGLSDLQEARRLNPNHLRILIALGNHWNLGRRNAEAKRTFEEALRRNPDSEFSHNGLANALSQEGKENEALRAYSRAIELQPKNATFLRNRSFVYQKTKRFADAAADLDAARKLNPNDADTCNLLSLLHLAQDRLAEALRLNDDALAMGDDSGLFYANRGQILYRLGRTEEALSAFQKSLELHPKLAAGYSGRGTVRSKMKQYESAIEDFTRAIELDPSHLDAYTGRALAYDDQGEYRKAIANYTEALRLKPAEPTALTLRSRCYRKLGEYQAALDDCNRAVELDPKDPILFFDRGRVYQNLMQHVKAIEDFNRAISMHSEKRDYFFYFRGQSYYDTGNYDWAIQDCEQAIRLTPDYADPYLVRALAYHKKGDRARFMADHDTYKRLSKPK